MTVSVLNVYVKACGLKGVLLPKIRFQYSKDT